MINLIADCYSLNFLVYIVEMSSFFLMKANQRKVRECLKWVKEFWRRFDFANLEIFSIFLGVFVRIVKVTHFAQPLAHEIVLRHEK